MFYWHHQFWWLKNNFPRFLMINESVTPGPLYSFATNRILNKHCSFSRLSFGIRKSAEENNNIMRKNITSRPLFSTHTHTYTHEKNYKIYYNTIKSVHCTRSRVYVPLYKNIRTPKVSSPRWPLERVQKRVRDIAEQLFDFLRCFFIYFSRNATQRNSCVFRNRGRVAV